MILGGIGSLTGVVIGAIVINISFQFLAPENPQSNARVLFFFVLALVLVLAVRPRWLGAALVGAVIVFGFVTQAIVEAVAPSWPAGTSPRADVWPRSSGTGSSSPATPTSATSPT